MSVELMAQVWNLKIPTRAMRDVLLVMCDHAHDDGRSARPSIARIAWKVDLSERQIQRIIKDFRQMGVLKLEQAWGFHRANEYRVDLSVFEKKDPFTPKGGEVLYKGDMTPPPAVEDAPIDAPEIEEEPLEIKGDISGEKGDISGEKGDTRMSPEPSVLTIHKNTPPKAVSSDEFFDSLESASATPYQPHPLDAQTDDEFYLFDKINELRRMNYWTEIRRRFNTIEQQKAFRQAAEYFGPGLRLEIDSIFRGGFKDLPKVINILDGRRKSHRGETVKKPQAPLPAPTPKLIPRSRLGGQGVARD